MSQPGNRVCFTRDITVLQSKEMAVWRDITVSQSQ